MSPSPVAESLTPRHTWLVRAVWRPRTGSPPPPPGLQSCCLASTTFQPCTPQGPGLAVLPVYTASRGALQPTSSNYHPHVRSPEQASPAQAPPSPPLHPCFSWRHLIAPRAQGGAISPLPLTDQTHPLSEPGSSIAETPTALGAPGLAPTSSSPGMTLAGLALLSVQSWGRLSEQGQRGCSCEPPQWLCSPGASARPPGSPLGL